MTAAGATAEQTMAAATGAGASSQPLGWCHAHPSTLVPTLDEVDPKLATAVHNKMNHYRIFLCKNAHCSITCVRHDNVRHMRNGRVTARTRLRLYAAWQQSGQWLESAGLEEEPRRRPFFHVDSTRNMYRLGYKSSTFKGISNLP